MKFINMLFSEIKNLDSKIAKIMKFGMIISFIIALIATTTLITYEIFYSLPTLFYIGISLFRASLTFAVMFFICAIGFDTLKNEFKNL